jgi:hypothetical protein
VIRLGFFAPKYQGKSTLACALTDLGALLVTDDSLVLRPGTPVHGGPGVPSLRLRREAARHLGRSLGVNRNLKATGVTPSNR